MPTLYLVAQNPKNFTKSGGWVRAEKWQASRPVDYFSKDIVGFDVLRMPEHITVARSLDDARAIAIGGEKQRTRASNQGYPIFEIDYSADDLLPPSAAAADPSALTTINTYPVDSTKCRFNGNVHLSHIHPSLTDIRRSALSLDDSNSDDIGLISGQQRHQSRWATFAATVRNAPSNAWHYMKPKRGSDGYERHNQDRAQPKPASRVGAGLKAFGHSLWKTLKNWGPVFALATAGITLFYFTGGTNLLMNWFLSMGLKSAAAASLTTVGTLGVGILTVGVCKAAYKGIQAAAHYGKAGFTAVRVKYVDYTESRANAANEAQHRQAMLLAEQLGYDLKQGAPAQFEAVYADSDSAHKAKLLERELLMFNQVRAATDPKARQAAEDAALRDLAAIQADVQAHRVAPGVH